MYFSKYIVSILTLVSFSNCLCIYININYVRFLSSTSSYTENEIWATI